MRAHRTLNRPVSLSRSFFFFLENMKTFKRTLSERKEKRWRLSAAQYKKDLSPPPPSLPCLLLILPSFSLVCRPLSSSAHNLATHPPSSPPLPAFRCWLGAHTHARARTETSTHLFIALSRSDTHPQACTHTHTDTQADSVNKKPSAVRGRRHSTPPSCHCD